MPRIASLYISFFVALAMLPVIGGAQEEKVPSGKELRALVEKYLAADEAGRAEIRRECDGRYADLAHGAELDKLRKELLGLAMKAGPKLKGSGNQYFYDEKTKRGRFILKGRPGKTLFIALHGGGVGQGDAGNLTGAMGGGGWWWIFPEVLEKTEKGWTTSGTEEFVLELVEAAKRTGKVDPNQVYITGHSMGGYGSWTLGAHHPDVFAGVAAYAGAPSPIWIGDPKNGEIEAIETGILPNYFNLRLHFFQSMDDQNVPAFANEFAAKALAQLKKEYPDGFDYQYDRVDGRGHAAPEAGYMPTQKWVAERPRDPRPKKLLWEPSLTWKRHFFWLYWHEPMLGSLLKAQTKPDNVVEIDMLQGFGDLKGMSVLLGEPLVDPTKVVTIKVDGEIKFEGPLVPKLSTLLLTLPRNDADLLFDCRVDL